MTINFKVTRPITRTIKIKLMCLKCKSMGIRTIIWLFLCVTKLRSSTSDGRVVSFLRKSVLNLRFIPSKMSKLCANGSAMFRSRFIRLHPCQDNRLVRCLITLRNNNFRFLFCLIMLFQVFMLRTRIFRFYLSFMRTRTINRQNVGVRYFTYGLRLLIKWRKTRYARIVRAINCLSRSGPSVIKRDRRRLLRILYLHQNAITRSATKGLYRPICGLNSFKARSIFGVLCNMINILRRVVRRYQTCKDEPRSCLVASGLYRDGKIRSMKLTKAALSTLVHLINGIRYFNCCFSTLTILNNRVIIRRFLRYLFSRFLFNFFLFLLACVFFRVLLSPFFASLFTGVDGFRRQTDICIFVCGSSDTFLQEF